MTDSDLDGDIVDRVVDRVTRRLGGYDILELGLYTATRLYEALDIACTRELLLEIAEKLV